MTFARGSSDNAIVKNNIFAGSFGNGALNISNSNNAEIAYNDFWLNENGNFTGTPDPNLGNITTTNNNGDPCDQFNNIFLNPQFVDAGNGDYNLDGSSPCIDAGDPSSPQDPDATIADQGAFYFDQTE